MPVGSKTDYVLIAMASIYSYLENNDDCQFILNNLLYNLEKPELQIESMKTKPVQYYNTIIGTIVP